MHVTTIGLGDARRPRPSLSGLGRSLRSLALALVPTTKPLTPDERAKVLAYLRELQAAPDGFLADGVSVAGDYAGALAVRHGFAYGGPGSGCGVEMRPKGEAFLAENG